MSKEYEEIYNQHEGSGFEFNYNKRHLGKSKTIFKDEVIKINQSKRNSDDVPLFVYCQSCGEYMDFKTGLKNDLDGNWTCRLCGVKVRERTVYSQLERDNDDDYEKYYEDKDDDPEWL